METQEIKTQEIKTAVIILNWNGKNWLEKFLETLIKHSQNTNIFIGDNASTDDSISFVRKKFPSVKIIINKQNDGYAKGYNNVLSQISAKYYV